MMMNKFLVPFLTSLFLFLFVITTIGIPLFPTTPYFVKITPCSKLAEFLFWCYKPSSTTNDIHEALLNLLVDSREIHPLDPQPHRHSMLVPTVCAPRVTRCSLGKYWSRDWFRGNFSLTQGLWNQQAANPGVHMLSLTHSGVRQRNLMTHAQCPLPVYYSQLIGSFPWCCTTQILLLQSCMYYMLTHLFSGYLCCLTQILVLRKHGELRDVFL